MLVVRGENVRGRSAANTLVRVSVVVCTRNRAAALKAAIEAYRRVTTTVPWELIVVDNGSTDETAAALIDLAAAFPIPLRVVFERSKGLCRARNAGWRAARAPVIAFSDDDCYPAPEFIDCIDENFAQDDLGFVGGRVLLFDPEDFPITIQPKDSRIDIAAGEFIESGLIHGANLAVRRSVLEALGGFDELLGAGTSCPAGDDTDFVNRASAAGFAGAYDPRPVVFHHHRRRTPREVGYLIRAYNIGRGAYFMKAMLDQRRRTVASRQWYWRSFLPAMQSRSGAIKCLQELGGGLRYLLARLRTG